MDIQRRHIAAIFDAIEVGLDGISESAGFRSVTNAPFPRVGEINPDTFNRANITIDGEVYTVSIFRPAGFRSVTNAPFPPAVYEEPECPKSTHGRHTTVDGKCIGCGEQVS